MEWLRFRRTFSFLLLLGALFSPTFVYGDEGHELVRLSLERYQGLLGEQALSNSQKLSWGMANAQVRLQGEKAGSLLVTTEVLLENQHNEDLYVPLLPSEVLIQTLAFEGERGTPTLSAKGAFHALFVPKNMPQKRLKLSYVLPLDLNSGAVFAILPMLPAPSTRLSIQGIQNFPGKLELSPGLELQRSGNELLFEVPRVLAVALRFGEEKLGVRKLVHQFDVGEKAEKQLFIRSQVEVELSRESGRLALPAKGFFLVDAKENQRPLSLESGNGGLELLISGKGRHQVELSYYVTIDRDQGSPKVRLPMFHAAISKIEATLAGHRQLDGEPPLAMKSTFRGTAENGKTEVLAHGVSSESLELSWTEASLEEALEDELAINAESYQLLSMGEGVIQGEALIHYDIIRGQTRELSIALPEKTVLFDLSGDGVEDWRIFSGQEDGQRQVRVFFSSDKKGKVNLLLKFEKPVSREVGDTLELPLLKPLGLSRSKGVLGLFDGKERGFGELQAEGLVKAGEDAFPLELRQRFSGRVLRQSYQYLGALPALLTKLEEPKIEEERFDVTIESLYDFESHSMQSDHRLTVDVKSGRLDRILLSLPKGVQVGSDLSAPSLSRADWLKSGDEEAEEGRAIFEIRLTRALEGVFRIELHLETLLNESFLEGEDKAEDAAYLIPDIRVIGASLHKGVLALSSASELELKPKELSQLNKQDLGSLPKSLALRAERDIALAYHYSYIEGAWKLQLGLKRRALVSTLDAKILHLRGESKVSEDGTVLSQVAFWVDNEDKAQLNLRLPKGAKLLASAIDGVAMNPISGGDGLLKFPLSRQKLQKVELAMMERHDALEDIGGLALFLPEPDILLRDLKWRVLMPETPPVLWLKTKLKRLDSRDFESDEWQLSEAMGFLASPSQGTEGGELRESGNYYFGLDIHEPSEALSLGLHFELRNAHSFGSYLAMLLAFLLFAFAVAMRHKQRKRVTLLIFLTAAAMVLIGRELLWEVKALEAFAFVVGLLVVWFITRKKRVLRKSMEDGY